MRVSIPHLTKFDVGGVQHWGACTVCSGITNFLHLAISNDFWHGQLDAYFNEWYSSTAVSSLLSSKIYRHGHRNLRRFLHCQMASIITIVFCNMHTIWFRLTGFKKPRFSKKHSLSGFPHFYWAYCGFLDEHC